MARGEGGLSEAIRRALDVYGADTGKEVTGNIRDWITQNYPGLDVESASFGSALSTLRKKVREGEGVSTKKSKRGRPRKQEAVSKPLASRSSIMRTMAAKDSGDLEEFVDVFQQLQDLSERLGGKDSLMRLIEIIPE